MEAYVILGSWTQQGVTSIAELPQRIEQAKAAVQASGGRWLGWWMTFGRYDFILITEAPSAEAAAATLLASGALGNVRTETMRAFGEESLGTILGMMP